MKLLFDQNLSPKLVRLLADIYPDSEHVSQIAMDSASDSEIWSYAAIHGFTIVSKDADFHQRSFILGYPPKIIWIRRGNCPTAVIVDILRHGFIAVRRFHENQEATFLTLA